MTATVGEDEKRLIRTALVVDYTEVFKQLLERVKRAIVLDEAGRTHIRVPRDNLTDAQVIALNLVGQKFANTIGLVPKDTMSAEDLSKSTGIRYNVVTARVTGLKKKGWVESDARGEYRVVYMAIEPILNEVQPPTGVST